MISRGGFAAQAAAGLLVLLAGAAAAEEKTPEQLGKERDESWKAMSFVPAKAVRFIPIKTPKELRKGNEAAACTMHAVLGSDGKLGKVQVQQVSANVDLILEGAVAWMCDTPYHPATFHDVPVPDRIGRTITLGQGPTPPLQPPREPLVYDCSRRTWLKEVGSPQDKERSIDVRRGGPEPVWVNTMVALKEIEARFPDMTFSPGSGGFGSLMFNADHFFAKVQVLPGERNFRLINLLYQLDLSPLRTAEGIGAESTCEQIRAAYGTPARSSSWRGEEQLGYEFGGTPVWFECKEGRVRILHVGELVTEQQGAP